MLLPILSPQNNTIVSLLQRCRTLEHLKQTHAHLTTTQPSSIARILSFFAFSHLSYANHVFSLIPNPTVFMYNTLIRAHSTSSPPHIAFSLYIQMLRNRTFPNKFTFTFLIKACSLSLSSKLLSDLHSHVVKWGFAYDAFLQSGFVQLYANCGLIDNARQVFDQIVERDVVSWTALLSGYAKCGMIKTAREVFDGMPEKNSVSWAAMIAGYAQSGSYEKAIEMFNEMQFANLHPTQATLVCILSACAQVGALDQGQWVHAYIKRNKVPRTLSIDTALINMYARCGCIENSVQVFNQMPQRDTHAWTSMICGMAIHGLGHEAINTFEDMLSSGAKPDGVTFVGVLTACSHACLVDMGRHYFHIMGEIYQIASGAEHYGCMVDMYGRCGLLDEAWELVMAMRMRPDAIVLKALLSACYNHGHVGMAEWAAKRLIEVDPCHGASYVMLSNVYSGGERWGDAEGVRSMMREKGIAKVPGCSLIEVRGVLHRFVVGEKEHPLMREINLMLVEMGRRLRLAGYVPAVKQVLFDIDEEERENILGRHSEKLAIAFGLLSIEAPAPIRVLKNLRVCLDCHVATKLISKVFEREIVVRDNLRFHRFVGGSCSCMDYW
ncbi:pentatricopeptide repeat-containing protein At3g62890-like [Amborella trichopoda]|uniref:pentatricopeptide repeat-containing protein At3g62890-like n=1 Tax=Amborella trichopoda TaxID=13333 RepID=UPI0009BD0061|nr:pentatricopeptide repeat-containing protein At3g62890-like [Amborella trichopoda]|eukprot:XP_011623672.2 pentatricopeptide repeat-containing protein At3g62890-like [Amborella trichopoda]